MPPARRCSECGGSLDGRSTLTVTCTPKCKAKRHRRIAAAKRQGAATTNKVNERMGDLQAHARDEVDDVMREVLREEARPIAREALTEEVLRSLQEMIGLVPQAVENLAADLLSGDDRYRQKATELLLRYTLGNQSIAPTAQNNPAPMQVTLNWPTAPGAPPAPALDVPEADVVEDIAPAETPTGPALAQRECMECHATKPAAAFIGASERCATCHAELLATVHARFGPTSTEGA